VCKNILQLFFEDLNYAMSLLKISYHHISSVKVHSPKRHQVCVGCLLSRQILLEHLDPWRWDWLVIPNCQNGITTLCCVQSLERDEISKHVQFQCAFPSGECQMVEYKCVLWHNLRKHCLVG